jgi:hypothetical protein
MKVLGLTLLVLLLGLPGWAQALPVRDIPGLVSISFWERTGGSAPTESVFAVDGTELTTRLEDPLGAGNHDISGATSEYYDVFYSNADGSFNLAGEYLTIEGVFQQSLPSGGGLNLAEIGLGFDGAAVEFGNFVANFFAFGDNALPETVVRAIDGDLQTHTTMGNTIDAPERLRVTLGFASSSGTVPEPSTSVLIGLAALGVLARREESTSR